jgi:UMF1 family MFS transporter
LVLIVFGQLCALAYLSHTHTFILWRFAGLVLGGIQSLSRSTYSKLLQKRKIPLRFYDVAEK